ncbi:DoxX family protein [Natrinema soli]|uniref:DoxX family protein n=1 Tax=Natrinema soli TaxID=1930624 RepID=A0ABD5SFG4_9EURY|nr:DoxX family protein [Natrinema soli]
MTSEVREPNASESKRTRWAGRILSGSAVLFLLFNAIPRALGLSWAVAVIADLGYPEYLVSWLGIALLACTILYVIPRTAVLGAILLTGYLGGAAATNVRVEDPWFLLPVFIGVLIWGGLYLRNERVRALVPLQPSSG